jgi:hypothetical protein
VVANHRNYTFKTNLRKRFNLTVDIGGLSFLHTTMGNQSHESGVFLKVWTTLEYKLLQLNKKALLSNIHIECRHLILKERKLCVH